MTSNPNDITHRGRVVEVHEGAVSVVIIAQAACGSCRVKGACGMGERAEKIFFVSTDGFYAYRVGEEVELSISRAMGLKAAAVMYVVPMLLMLGTLIGATKAGVNEALAALLTLGALAGYYILLYLLRKKIPWGIVVKVLPVVADNSTPIDCE